MDQAANRPVLDVVTGAGAFAVEVHVDAAPTTAAYVLDLVRRGRYDGSSFYRSTTLGQERAPLIQGGPWGDVICGATTVGPDIAMLEDFETTEASGLTHVCGAVSLARDLGRTDHALSEWFICLDDYADLDFGGRIEPDDLGFPVFGTVVAGLDVVRAIAGGQTGAATTVGRLAGEILVEPVRIRSVMVRT